MDTVRVKKQSEEQSRPFVLTLLQRINTNLCLGRSLPAIHSPIGSDLIWMFTIQQPDISLAPSTTMADSMYVFMCVKFITNEESCQFNTADREIGQLCWFTTGRGAALEQD